YQEYWISPLHHSSFSSLHATESLDLLNKALLAGKQALQQAQYIVITWGTARIYTLKETGSIVGNCHKVPARYFERSMLQVETIVSAYSQLIKKLKTLNASLKLIFTISPIRHSHDGFVENQLSKSSLFVALHELKTQHLEISYFPSYEIIMDDLRDYRFYEADMIHPNNQAIEYIWEHFRETYFSASAIQLMQQIKSIQKASQHQVFHPKSLAHQKFIATQLSKIDHLISRYPFLDLSWERQHFLNELSSSSDRH
ncbi:MAG: GSCFA domain-containing protein, partial [Planctomycetota bacterium]